MPLKACCAEASNIFVIEFKETRKISKFNFGSVFKCKGEGKVVAVL
jgi:hypothetical protein